VLLVYVATVRVIEFSIIYCDAFLIGELQVLFWPY